MSILVQATVVRIEGQAAAVKYRDSDGIWQGKVISTGHLPDARSGQVVHILSEALEESGTEYGFDWNVALDEIVLKPVDFQQSLRDHGIWTVEDMQNYPNEVVAAFLAVARRMCSDFIRKARESFIM